MTIAEMHIAVKLELDKTASLELPAFEPEEISYWLNSSIRRFVKSRYGGANNKGTGFEETQKRTDDIRTLIERETVTTPSSSSDYPNGYIYTLPVEGSGVGSENYWVTLSEQCMISVDGTTSLVGITECTMDEYRQKLDDPYSEHILHYQTAKPLRLFDNESVVLITDGNYTITSYYLTYLKKPAEVQLSGSLVIGVNCDLPEHTHDEIVKLAVSMMLENIEQPRYSTYMNEIGTME